MDRYLKELKRKNIQNFIEENGYAPNRDQIKEMETESLKRYTDLNRYGFSGFDIIKSEFKKSLSKRNSSKPQRKIRV